MEGRGLRGTQDQEAGDFWREESVWAAGDRLVNYCTSFRNAGRFVVREGVGRGGGLKRMWGGRGVGVQQKKLVKGVFFVRRTERDSADQNRVSARGETGENPGWLGSGRVQWRLAWICGRNAAKCDGLRSGKKICGVNCG